MEKNKYKIIFDNIKNKKNFIVKDFDNPYSEISEEELSEINEIMKFSDSLKEPEPQFFTTTI